MCNKPIGVSGVVAGEGTGFIPPSPPQATDFLPTLKGAPRACEGIVYHMDFFWLTLSQIQKHFRLHIPYSLLEPVFSYENFVVHFELQLLVAPSLLTILVIM